MNPIALAALIFCLGFGISMFVAGVIRLLFLGIQMSQRRAAAVASARADADMPVLGAGDGGVTP